MRGLMMDRPLLLTHFLERARTLYPRQEIVSRLPSGVHRTTYAEVFERVRRLARSLADLGVAPGERVGT
ncbi:MAG: AMP-binding protein, partial [Candidatus Binatia bacterium]